MRGVRTLVLASAPQISLLAAGIRMTHVVTDYIRVFGKNIRGRLSSKKSAAIYVTYTIAGVGDIHHPILAGENGLTS